MWYKARYGPAAGAETRACSGPSADNSDLTRPDLARTAAQAIAVQAIAVHSAPPWDHGHLCAAAARRTQQPSLHAACPRPLVSGGLTDERCSVRIQSCRRASVQQRDGSKERPCALCIRPFLVLQPCQGLRVHAIGPGAHLFSRCPPCGAAPLDEPPSQHWKRERRSRVEHACCTWARAAAASGCERQKVTRSLSPNCAPASHQPG